MPAPTFARCSRAAFAAGTFLALAVAAPQAANAVSAAPHPSLNGCEGVAPIVCSFPDLAPGGYDVRVVLGDDAHAADTAVYVEARRLMLDKVDTAPGEIESYRFTVDVRDPEGQQNKPKGTGAPGLTLVFSGDEPAVERISVTPASEDTQKIALLGDSTVTDWEEGPTTGWGQRLPTHFNRGVAVVNHSGSGESTVSMLAKSQMFDALLPQIGPGDLALIQLAHNDKTTTAEQYRVNLTEMIDRVEERGATAVLVTPIARHRFNPDGTLTDLGLIVTAEADLPSEIRAVAAQRHVPLIDLTKRTQELLEAGGDAPTADLYMIPFTGDRTHTSDKGATVFAGLVADELRGLGLVEEADWRTLTPYRS